MSLETLLVQQCLRLDGISAGYLLLVNANSCGCHVDNYWPLQGPWMHADLQGGSGSPKSIDAWPETRSLTEWKRHSQGYFVLQQD